ncbi:hypothetical protein [Aliiroseovarius sp. 2305UL8-7]|uniref:hypothetical protein n=1 Tax=Aliiroseovarius conchicola TaxID=3121637 RepID=UPI0035294727
MSDAQVQDFQKRVRGVSRQHRRLSRGYVQLVERNGLLVPKTSKVRRGFPIKGLLATIVGFVAFKAFLFNQVGAVNYTDRIDTLGQGTVLEKAGSWIMQADVLTVAISNWMSGLI